jgi:serine/threonine protein phosphatase 1
MPPLGWRHPQQVKGTYMISCDAVLTYAVGDIHGRFDLLKEALGTIDLHASDRPHRLVFLGDYIDRGPDSRRVVERLSALAETGRAICLKGNHEQMAVRAAYFGEADHWLSNGGDATLMSYGGSIPLAHVEWMDARPLTCREGQRLFVHAGVLPGSHDDPDEEVALWIRERFLRASAEDLGGLHVVHGHTPSWAGKAIAHMPERLPHRTNLDTGAYFTGVLSVGVFGAEQSGPIEILNITA